MQKLQPINNQPEDRKYVIFSSSDSTFEKIIDSTFKILEPKIPENFNYFTKIVFFLDRRLRL